MLCLVLVYYYPMLPRPTISLLLFIKNKSKLKTNIMLGKVNFAKMAAIFFHFQLLTGELMRMSINSIGWGEMLLPGRLCAVLQHLQLTYQKCCSTAGGEMGRKMQTLKNSVTKVLVQHSVLFVDL